MSLVRLTNSDLFNQFNSRSVTYWDVAIVRIEFIYHVGFIRLHTECIPLEVDAQFCNWSYKVR